MLASMRGETAPVYAPVSSKYADWPPMRTPPRSAASAASAARSARPPEAAATTLVVAFPAPAQLRARASRAAAMNGNGGMMVTSHGAAAQCAHTRCARSRASFSVVGFIFQLAAMNGRRRDVAAGGARWTAAEAAHAEALSRLIVRREPYLPANAPPTPAEFKHAEEPKVAEASGEAEAEDSGGALAGR